MNGLGGTEGRKGVGGIMGRRSPYGAFGGSEGRRDLHGVLGRGVLRDEKKMRGWW